MLFQQAYAASVLPLQGTDVATQWDSLYNFLVWLSIFFFILVVGGMIYFTVKYRHHGGAKSEYITGNHLIEILWTIIPTVLLMVIFGWGYVVYNSMTRAPSDSMEIRVIAKQWTWQFVYDDGKTFYNQVFVPVNKPVKFVMTSEDVIHSMFVPNFRVKQDVVPGMYTSVWFEATVPGKHQIFCTEYCGTGHSLMLAQVIALTDQQWKDFKRGKKLPEIPRAGQELTVAPGSAPAAPQAGVAIRQTSLSEQGKQLVVTKGCVACHSADGSSKIGPTFKGLYDEQVELSDGHKILADENYLRESIENPNAKLVKGFGPVMPTFKGLINETEMSAILAYIRSVKKPVAQ